jgi:hypothetical protein
MNDEDKIKLHDFCVNMYSKDLQIVRLRVTVSMLL